MAATPNRDDRERRLRAAAEFNGRPVLTVLCCAAMMAFGLVPIVLAARTALAARGWVATPIEVVSAGVREDTAGDSEAPVAEARATYRYRFGRLSYSGHRIGVHLQGADNMGGWQRRWARRLAAHPDPPVMAWVDPAHPEDAVLDRSLRGSVLLFHACFAAVPAWPLYVAARALVARFRLRGARPPRGR